MQCLLLVPSPFHEQKPGRRLALKRLKEVTVSLCHHSLPLGIPPIEILCVVVWGRSQRYLQRLLQSDCFSSCIIARSYVTPNICKQGQK